MPRYKLTIEYDGTPFVGWQIQPNAKTVQGELKNALHQFCGEDIIPQGSGRTDSGVHALGQVAHIDLSKEHDPYRIQQGLNFYLRPLPIVVRTVEAVDDEFNARFSAKKRIYQYKIVNRRADLALDVGRAWLVRPSLDISLIQAGAECFIGRHDFTSFRASECQADSPIRTLDKIDIQQNGDTILVNVESKSFLHHQVRNIVGTLKNVGTGKWPPAIIPNIMAAKDRTQAGQTAPACGLYFMQVEY